MRTLEFVRSHRKTFTEWQSQSFPASVSESKLTHRMATTVPFLLQVSNGIISFDLFLMWDTHLHSSRHFSKFLGSYCRLPKDVLTDLHF